MNKNHAKIVRLFMVCCLIVVFFVPPAFGRWAKSFGTDQGITGTLMPSVFGGYVLTGVTEAESQPDWYIARIDSSGGVTWAKKLPGTGDDFLVATELSDGGFFVQGETTQGTGGGTNALWAKFNASFNPVWQYVFGGDGNDYAAFMPTQDGGFIGGGLSDSYGSGTDMLIIKLNTSGGISWSKVLSIAENDQDFSILEVTGGYVMSTTLDVSDGGQDVVLIKLNTSGVVQWAKRYKAGDKSKNWAFVSETSDGHLFLSGQTIPSFLPMGDHANDVDFPTMTSDMLLMKVNASNGSIIWDWKYGNDNYFLGALSWENADGTFSLCGVITDFFTSAVTGNIVILELDSTGSINSQKMTTNDDIYGFFYKQQDGAYHLLGTQVEVEGAESVVNVLYGKFDSALNPVWVKTFGGDKTDFGFLNYTSGQYFLSGTSLSFDYGKSSIFGVTLDSTGGYSDCQPYFQDFSITWSTSQLTATDLGWAVETIAYEEITQPYSPETTSISVETATLTIKDICGSTPESVVYVGKSGCGGNSPCVSSITDGIASAAGGGTVKVGEGTYIENVLMNEGKTLRLQGYDTAYTNPSTPEIQGSLTIRNGKIIIDEGGFILIP